VRFYLSQEIKPWSTFLLFSMIVGVGKCLKVVHQTRVNVTIGQAMVACASEQARLVALQSCDQVSISQILKNKIKNI